MQDTRTATIVVIDDNADNLFITLQLLRTKLSGVTSSGWGGGDRFFAWLEQEPERHIDLVLLDIQMPDMDGFAVMKRLRARTDLRIAKIVAITAHVMPDDVERIRNAGFDGLIGKPLHPERFPHYIRKILDGDRVWVPR